VLLINQIKLYKIKSITDKEFKEFLNKNHLQGYASCKYRFGLVYNGDELVCVIGLNTPRFDKDYDLELVRFCNKLDYIVIGGMNKLISYIDKTLDFKSIISYVDRKLFTGHSYYKCGFELVKSTRPSYVYVNVNTGKVVSRFKAQKHKLDTLLENYDPNLSEKENMNRNKYFRVYDCGTFVFRRLKK